MIFIIVLIIEIVCLFFSSRLLTKSLSFIPINLISLIFLPGIIIHELSHLLFASALFVPAGEIEFMPKVEGRSIKLGSLMIGKTDPVRRFLIGASPVIVGVLIIGLILYFTKSLTAPLYVNFLIFYVLFVVGNTMFSSRKDMEGSLILLALVIIFLGAFYFFGFKIPKEFFANVSSKGSLFTQIDYFLPLVIGLDIGLYLLGKRVRR